MDAAIDQTWAALAAQAAALGAQWTGATAPWLALRALIQPVPAAAPRVVVVDPDAVLGPLAGPGAWR